MHTRGHGVAILAFCCLQATLCMYLSEPSRGTEVARLGDENLRSEASTTMATHSAANDHIGENSEASAKPKLRISRPIPSIGIITTSNGKTEITLTAGAKLKVGSEEWKKSQRQSMRRNFQLLRQTVANLKHRIAHDNTYWFILRSQKTNNFLEYIENLEKVHKVLLTPIQNRLFRLKGHSLIISPHELEAGPPEVEAGSRMQAAEQNPKVKESDPSTPSQDKTYESDGTSSMKPNQPPKIPETHWDSGELSGDALDGVVAKTNWDLLVYLNDLLKQISTVEVWKQAKKGPWYQNTLDLQQSIFQTVDFMYSHELITKETLQGFFGLEGSIGIAAYIMAKDGAWVGTVFAKKFKNLRSPTHPYSDAFSKVIWDIIQERNKQKIGDLLST